MFGNCLIGILNCVSQFVSIILNFYALCDAYAAQRHYTVLFKNNKIFCLTFGITFRNYFLMVSNEVEDHLWLYFVYLNHLLIYKEKLLLIFFIKALQ